MEQHIQPIRITLDSITLLGELGIPSGATGIVIFAHGSGSSRLSPRNIFVADALRQRGIGTLLFDLLTKEEDRNYNTRFDIDLLTERLVLATGWFMARTDTKELAIGYFGASTGSASALRAAAVLGESISAVVSRGGRPDLAGEILADVKAATLFIVGGADEVVLELNREAYAQLNTVKEFVIVPEATHLFEEPGALEEVARLAGDWFTRYLRGRLRHAA